MQGPQLRHALRADLPSVADVWVDAFTDDPYLRWMGGQSEWSAFGPAWMMFIAELAFERGHTYLDSSASVAVAWIPPDLSFAQPDDVARGRAIIAAHAGETRAEDALASIMATRQYSLEVPHWTLQYVGVRAAGRGRGLGAVAVRPILDVCDAEGLACGLVSTNPRNVSFYERCGFRPVGEVVTPDGAATLRPMHRAPAPS